MNYLTDTKKAKYHLKNPSKYYGANSPIYKSGWEAQIFDFMDTNDRVLKWAYENFQVPYYNPVLRRQSVYFPDIFCHVKQVNGEVKQFLIEIKPYKFTIPPSEPKSPKTMNSNTIKKYQKGMIRYQKAKLDYAVNISKWQQAKSWCDRHKIEFKLVTEKNYNF